MNSRYFLIAVFLLPPVFGNDSETAASLAKLRKSADFTRIQNGPVIQVDLKYATTDNFLKQNLYGNFTECYLHNNAAAKFAEAKKILIGRHRGYKFLIFDCLRPRSVQRLLWAKVEGTKQEPYVANPDRGSIHNYGFAIDLTLVDANGVELDMGTPFDSFSKKSEPRLEEKFIVSGKLTAAQISNRRLLRAVMTEAGFQQQVNEWWHYNAEVSKTLKKKKHRIFE